MTIQRIYIKSFGNLIDFTLTPKESINVICGNNESGKSTVAAFIKFMFYGFSSKKGRDNSFSAAERYINWDTHEASGVLEITTKDGTPYRIEREVYQSGKKSVGSVKIINLNDGAKVSAEPDDLFLGGAPEEVFNKTLFISQAGGNAVDTEAIHTSVENMLSGGDESVNTKKALSRLDSARITLLYKNEKGGKIHALRQSINELAQKKYTIAKESARIDALKEEIKGLDLESKAQRKLIDDLDERIDCLESAERLEHIEATINAKNNIEALEKEHFKFTDSVRYNGFLPDKDYLKKLEGRIREYYSCLEDLREITKRRDTVKANYEQLLEKDTGRDIPLESISKSINSEDKKRVKLKTLSGYFLIGGASLLLLLIISLFAFPQLSVFFGVMTVAAGLFFGGIRYLMRSSENAIISMLESVGAQSVEELKKFRSNQGRMSEKRNILAKEIGNAEKAIFDKNEELQGIISECSLLGQRYGNVCRSISECESFAEKIRAIVEKCENGSHLILRKKEELRLNGESFTAEEYVTLKDKVRSLPDDPSPLRTRLLGAKSDRRRAEQEYISLQAQITDKKMALTSLIAGFEDEAAIDKRISRLSKSLEELTFIHEALILAEQSLEKASSAARDRIAPSLSELSSSFILNATGGKYDKINVDNRLKLSYTENETTRQIDHLSEGTQDIVYLAFRLSLVSMLFDDPPPIIIDEGLAGMDDDRLASVLGGIAEHARRQQEQVFIFSPTKREAMASKGLENAAVLPLSEGFAD